MASSFDLVIERGLMEDGTGNPWLKKDAGISEGKIRKVGYITENNGEAIDAKGMLVSQGFVDLHNHSDFSILAYPNAESYIMQRVTEEINMLFTNHLHLPIV